MEAPRNCELYNNGLFTGNLINSLKGLVTSLDMLMAEWEDKRGNWEDVKGMFKNPRYVFILSNMDESIYNMYYWSSMDTYVALKSNKQRYLEIVDIVDICFKVVCFGLAGFVVYISIAYVQKSMVEIYSVIFLVPMFLIQKNKILMVRLEKVAKGDAGNIF